MPEGPDNTDLSLESGGAGTWDQFATNSQLFGAQSTYDENLYTTAIDRSAPSYKRREAEAARIAREIEGQTSANSHVREERGHAVEHDGEDEEDKYSGVRREERPFNPLPVGGLNKYTPPARRAPTGQATVPGVPVDPAIITAQMAPPKPRQGNKISSDIEKSSMLPAEDSTPAQQSGSTASVSPSPSKETLAPSTETETETDPSRADLNTKLSAQGPTENVEVKVLNQFRQFADIEKQRVIERRKAQATQDRSAKLNELMRFSKTFKLKTPIPSDLIGILAKDPVKQEAIVERAQKDHTDSVVPTVNSTPVPAVPASTRKSDAPQSQPTMPDRQAYGRGRGGYPTNGRPDRTGSQQQPQPPLFPSRNGSGAYPSRFSHQPAGKGMQPHQIPAPIPIIDGRIPPAGPMADQSGLSSPQRSNMHTPASTISGKFNLNVKASEFRPNAAATTFNPANSQPPSSPSSTQRAASISRTASPSAFFGNRKPKPLSERLSVTKDFNPIARMRKELAASSPEEPTKNYGNNGGIPNAFQTVPRWTVRNENAEKTYEEAFDRPVVPVLSPSQSRSASTQHAHYPGQGANLPNGPAVIPHISTPQHNPHAQGHQYPHQYDDGSHRMQFGTATPNMYASPSMASRQASAYASPMNHPAQLAYQQQQQQQPYFGTPGAQIPVGMRAYPGTPGMMHAQPGQMTAPMMVQQQSNGPYMTVPSQFGHQVPMYSPSPAHVYPQQNGYSSPQRIAPIMMHQGSQQGHVTAPSMMYSMSGQGGPMAYPQQQVGMARGNYGGHQYGNAPGYAMQHRTMSSGYPQIPQKGYGQHMQANHGPSMNGPPQGPAYTQMEGSQDEGK